MTAASFLGAADNIRYQRQYFISDPRYYSKGRWMPGTPVICVDDETRDAILFVWGTEHIEPLMPDLKTRNSGLRAFEMAAAVCESIAFSELHGEAP